MELTRNDLIVPVVLQDLETWKVRVVLQDLETWKVRNVGDG